jgi:hypothetical protein
MQSAPASYGSTVRSVNSDLALRTLEATFLFQHRMGEELHVHVAPVLAGRLVLVRPRKRTVLRLERALDAVEHGQRAVERGRVVGRHHARAQ